MFLIIVLDLGRVKVINQALVKEGFVKTRKASATANAYYWVSHKEVKPKVRRKWH